MTDMNTQKLGMLHEHLQGCSKCDYDEADGGLFKHCAGCQFVITTLAYELFGAPRAHSALTAPIAPGSAEVEQCVADLQTARRVCSESTMPNCVKSIDLAISLLRRISDEGRDSQRMDWLVEMCTSGGGKMDRGEMWLTFHWHKSKTLREAIDEKAED
jgi:hypothetical protein